MGKVRGYLNNNYGSLGVGSLGIGSIGYGSLGAGSIGINPESYGFLIISFVATQSPLNNLQMSFNDESTWSIDYGDRVTTDLASGDAQHNKSIDIGADLIFYAENNTSLTYLTCYGNQLEGTFPNNLSDYPDLTYFSCHTNDLIGSIPDLSTNVDLYYFSCHNNDLTGSIPDLPVSIVRFYCYSNQLTGTIPDLSTNVNLEEYSCKYNYGITGFVGGWPSSITNFNASWCGLTESAVNQILIDADTYGTAVGLYLNISGSTNAPATGAGITAINNLITNGAFVYTNN